MLILRSPPDQRWWLGMTHFYLALNHAEDATTDDHEPVPRFFNTARRYAV